MEPVIILKNISKEYDKKNFVLKNINLEIYAGEIHGFIGNNGAGKSTLIKMLAGLVPYTSGSIIIGNKVIYQQKLINVSYAGQDNSFIDNLNVRQNIILGNEITKKHILIDWSKIDNQLKRIMRKYNIFIDLNKKFSCLTLIEQRQVAILRALYKRPKILLLDEPTVGLSHNQKLTLLKIFQSFIDDKITVVFSTRDQEFALAVCHRYSILENKTINQTYKNELEKVTTINYFNWEKFINFNQKPILTNELLFYIEDLSINNENYQFLNNIDISVKKGEIVGIYDPQNLHGTLIGDIIIGKIFEKNARIFYENKNISSFNQEKRYQLGIDLIVENFLSDAVISNYSLVDNYILWHHSRKELTVGGILKRSEINFQVKKILEKYKMNKFISSETIANNLSNGELQKFIIARTLELKPKLTLLINPFDHLDLPSTKLVINNIIKYNREGMTFLLISSDPFLLQLLCNRINVIYDGKIINDINFIDQNLIEYKWKPIFEKMFAGNVKQNIKISKIKQNYYKFKQFIDKLKNKLSGG